MRGHQWILKARMAGRRPESVTLHDRAEFARDPDRWFPHWVYIEDTDRASRLDLRFLVGMDVTVELRDESRMLDFFDAAIIANAATVVGSHMPGSEIAKLLVFNGTETVQWPE